MRSLDGLAAALESFVPKAQGEVAAVEGDVLTITIGRREGLLPGLTLSLWREGKELLHPVTGRPLGRAENAVGTAEVLAVQERTATAAVRKRLQDPRPGDRVRTALKPISVAVTGAAGVRFDLITSLRERLAERRRFAVFDGPRTDAFFAARTAGAAASAREAGRELGVELVVAITAAAEKGRTIVTAEVLNTVSGASLGTVTALLEPAARSEVLGEIKPYFSSVLQRQDEIPLLPLRADLFATGDLDGDGRPEYVFSDGTRVFIYTLVPSGWKEAWSDVDAPAGDTGGVIAIGIADINGNGFPEVFATVSRKGGVISLVLEAREGAYRVIARLPLFLRVVAVPGKGRILVGQNVDPGTGYAGAPKVYRWAGDAYAADADFSLPEGLDLYGFVMLAPVGGAPLFVSLDETGRLLVHAGASVIWKSTQRYAVPARTVMLGGEQGRKPLTVRTGAPLLVLDIDGDGRDDIVVPRHNRTGVFRGQGESELHGLAWNGESLEGRWRVGGVPGAVFDLQGETGGGGPARAVVLLRTGGGWFVRQKSMVKRYVFQ